MDEDLRNEQSDEALSASLEPKLWLVTSEPKKLEDVVLDAIEAFKSYFDFQPFHLVTEGNLINIYYQDFDYPASSDQMLHYAFSLGLEISNATDRHIKNLFHSPKQTNHTPEYGC